MSTDRKIVLFDLFGVIARHQCPGALAKMADHCHAPTDAFTTAYWACRPPYDAGRQSAPEYWTAVLQRLSLPVDADTIEELRLTDIDSWSRVDDRMVAYVQSLRDVAEVALLSNIPSDHADAFLAAQPWLHHLHHVAFSGKIKVAKPDPAAFHHCVVAMQAAPVDFLFVDDREENVRAARATGMNGHVFTDHDELAAVIDTWLPIRRPTGKRLLSGGCDKLPAMTDLGPVAWPPAPIRTERLVLRESEARDRAAFIELFASPEVGTYIGGPRPRDELERAVPEVPGRRPGLFVIDLGGSMIGMITLDRRDPERPGHVRPDAGETELGYMFLPEAWGYGYAAEACAAALGWFADAHPGEPVVLCTQTANDRAMRLAAKLGFIEVERFEEYGAEQWFGVRSSATPSG